MKNMNKRLGKLKVGVSLFYQSAKKQMLSEDTILISAGVGLYQGLKYKGSFKQGIKAGLATMVTIGAVNGFLNFVEHKDKIKEL
jgi:hypothetical protein